MLYQKKMTPFGLPIVISKEGLKKNSGKLVVSENFFVVLYYHAHLHD